MSRYDLTISKFAPENITNTTDPPYNVEELAVLAVEGGDAGQIGEYDRGFKEECLI